MQVRAERHVARMARITVIESLQVARTVENFVRNRLNRKGESRLTEAPISLPRSAVRSRCRRVGPKINPRFPNTCVDSRLAAPARSGPTQPHCSKWLSTKQMRNLYPAELWTPEKSGEFAGANGGTVK